MSEDDIMTSHSSGSSESGDIPLFENTAPAGLMSSVNVAEGDFSFPVPKHEFTYNEYVEAMGFGISHLVIMVISGVTWAFDAQVTVLLSLILPVVLTMGFSVVEEVLFFGLCYLGSFSGAILSGYMSDLFGRKYGFIATAFFVFTFGMISVFTENDIILLVCMYFVGLGVGSCAVPFTYFTEIVPARGRGIYLLCFQLFWSFGSIVEAFLGLMFLNPYGWRVFLGVTVAPVFILLIISGFMPESPRWYYNKGKLSKSKSTLKLLRSGVPWTKKAPKDFQLVPEDNDDEVVEIEGGKPGIIKNKVVQAKGVMILFSKEYIATTLLLIPIWCSVTFVYYGIVFLTPLYFTSSDSANATYFYTMITTLAEVPGLLVAVFLVEIIGRKRVLTIYLFICGISTAVLLFPSISYIPDFVFVVATFLSRATILGAFDVVYMYTPEVYETEVRATAVGIFTSLARLAGAVSPLLPYVFTGSFMSVPILLYSIAALAASVFSIFLPIETTNRFLDAVL